MFDVQKPDRDRPVTHPKVRPSGCPIEIVAHRGASLEAPENTLASVELAWELRADAVEIDVQLSRDGHLAVIHDATLERTAGVDSKVCDLDMSELRTVDAGMWKADKWQGETIAELPQILATIPSGRRLFVELKGGGDPATHAEIVSALQRDLTDGNCSPGSVVLISFYPALLRSAKQSLPDFDAFLVVEQTQDILEPDGSGSSIGQWIPSIAEIIDVAQSSNFDGVDLSNTAVLTDDAINSIHQANLKSCVWTVNSIGDACRLARSGIGSLTTDDPRAMIAALSTSAR
jgi:glycerophosphoryl diester phosphodiesterase